MDLKTWRPTLAIVALLTAAACGGGGDAPAPVGEAGEYETIGGGPPGGVVVALLDG